MARLIDISFGFPTVIFTTLVLFSLAYWVVALAFGFADFDVEAELDADLSPDASDLSSDGATGDGANAGSSLSGVFRGLGVHYLPIPVAFSFVALIGWAFSLFATWLVASAGSAGVALGIIITLLALVVGLVVAGRIGRIMRPVFEVTPAVRRRDLIGRLCVIQTGRVDRDFGQAEVVDSEKSTHLVQVRCAIDNQLTAGAQALIVDVDDDGLFVVSPDVEAIT